MSTGRYSFNMKAAVLFAEAGLIEAFMNIRTDFTTLEEPVLSETPLIGEINTIGDAHTWAASKGAIKMYVFQDSLETPGESTGTKGSLRMKWTPKFFVVGDGPITKEMVENWMNEDLVGFTKNDCADDTFEQYGCDCKPLKVTKIAFSSGTLTGGQRGYTIETETFSKFFYQAALTIRTT